MFHEFGHEWWANLVTASDWRDFWIHEGFQSYMDTLYLEKTKGQAAYFEAMKKRAKSTRNKQPVAPREAKIAYQVYMAEPDYLSSDGDIYGKGACILHALRYLVGDKAFFRSLRRMAYPTKEMEKLTNGKQSRFVNTDDFETIAEKESGMDLAWFFELYLRQPVLPRLIVENAGTATNLRWETPNNMPFNMPIDAVINGKTQRIEFVNNKASIKSTDASLPVIDPNGWVLKEQ